MSQKIPLLIRVDASEDLGYGHLIRCIVLSEIMQANFLITFCCIKLPNEIANKILKDGMRIIDIKTEEEFIEMLNKETCVLIDGYQFNSEYHKKISQKVKTLIAIDERHEIEHHADILINNNPSLEESDFSIQPGCKVFTGVEYSILRHEFREQSKKPLSLTNLPSIGTDIFISFGGADPLNFSQQTLDVLFAMKEEDFNITLMLGPSFSNVINTDNLSDGTNFNVVKNLEPSEIIHYIATSNFVIVPASTILLEVFSVGAPVISGWYADNQQYSVKFFEASGMILNCGDFNIDFSQNLKNAIRRIKELPLHFHAKNQKSIDLSGEKILDIIDEHVK